MVDHLPPAHISLHTSHSADMGSPPAHHVPPSSPPLPSAPLLPLLLTSPQVAADMALLAAASERSGSGDGDEEDVGGGRTSSKGRGRGGEDVAEANVWVPPSGQKGDGKTALNERFGY